MGVIDGKGVGRKPVTTEGRSGPITSQSGTEKPGMNSGEAGKCLRNAYSTFKNALNSTLFSKKNLGKPSDKKRFGPPPPEGLIEIDSKEEFKRRT